MMKVANEMASMLQVFCNKKGLVHGGVNSKIILVAEDKSPVMYDFGSFSYFEHRQAYQELVSETLLFSWEISGRFDPFLRSLLVIYELSCLSFVNILCMST